jgi:NitT/TauT family transport system substrate-binding protein
VKWLTIEPAAKFVALSEKRADAVPDYTTGQPFWEKAVGKENLVRMPWSQRLRHVLDVDHGSEKTIERAPKVLRDFLAASYMGWRDVMADPKAALEIFKKRVPDIDLALIEPNMMLGPRADETERYAKNGIGLDGAGQDVPHGGGHQHATCPTCRARWAATRSSPTSS